MPTISGIIAPTSSESTGRRTLLDLTSEMARTVDGSDTTVLALAGDAVRAAIRAMNRKGNWPWELMDEDVNLTNGNKFSRVSSPVKKELAMHYLDGPAGTCDRRIGYTPYHVFLEQYTFDVDGEAWTYTIPNLFETGQIRWYPVPTANAYARFSFYRVTPAPLADDEVIEIPDYASEAYMSRAWFEFCKRLAAGQRPFPIELAAAEARLAFRELAAHVARAGDRVGDRY